MSQIKKALERAKAARLTEGVAGAVIPGRFRSFGALDAFSKRADDSEPGVIVYTNTRVIDVPREDLLKNRIVALEEAHPAADRFKSLRTHLFQLTRTQGWNTIQVSGFGGGEGTSTVAANLAVSIAKDIRQTALLVDLDFRRSSVARLFNLPAQSPGLKSYFLDETPLENLFLSPGIEKLTVLTAGGGGVANATELVGSPRMEALVKELKQRYNDRYVIFDTPGITASPDPLIISEYVDAILLVGRAGHSTQESIRATMESIPKQKLLGIVMNSVRDEE